MPIKFIQRSLWQRILGIPATAQPLHPDCWRYADGQVTVDLAKAPELNKQAGALRLEGKGLPQRVLLVRAEDGRLHAFHNRCTHLGHRRLDPVPGTGTLQCCSLNKSTYDLTGKNIYGPAPRPIATYPLEVEGEMVTIRIAG